MPLSEVLIPCIGLSFTACLFSSSVPGSWRARKTGVLAQDPTPSVTTFINTFLWVIYAAMTRDPWVYAGNLFGVICNSFNTVIAMRYGNQEIRARIDLIFCVGMTFLAVVMFALVSPTLVEDEDLRLNVVSFLCVALCMAMFASPLFQGFEALRLNDGSRINAALCLAQVGNGITWTSYGIGKGDITLIFPNSAAIVLAATNLIIKGFLTLRNANRAGRISKKAQEVPTAALCHALLADAIANGTPIVLRSLWFNGMTLHVEEKDKVDSFPQDIDLEQQSDVSYVRGAETSASAIQLVPMDHDQVALRIPDGRFLELQTSASPHAGSSQIQPSDVFVVARHCEKPGSQGHFVIVHAPAREQDTTTGRTLERDFGQDSVSFFNPALGLFLRCNEKGFFDSSPRWCSDVKSEGWRLPVGWLWERFAVELAPGEPAAACPLEVAISSSNDDSSNSNTKTTTIATAITNHNNSNHTKKASGRCEAQAQAQAQAPGTGPNAAGASVSVVVHSEDVLLRL